MTTSLTRRELLATGAGMALLGGVAGCSRDQATPAYTVESWVRDRGRTYLVGHRGAGDVVPEHTLESYEAAIGWGARAIEISVVRTSDGVLLCQHDLSYDRTTTLTGDVADQPASAAAAGRVDVPRLGPRWQGDARPRIAVLADVLDRVGGRAVLCIEAKDDAAYPDMVDMLEAKGLKASTIIKLDHRSSRFAQARSGAYPVFRYLGSVALATSDQIRATAGELDPANDYLVIPSNENGVLIDDGVIDAAVGTGVPTWVFGVHRRSELQHHFDRGVVGAVASSIGYVSGRLPARTEPGWSAGAMVPGEMSRRPESDDYGLGWPEPGVITLGSQGHQAFLTLGQLAPLPVPKGTFNLDLETRVDAAPADTSSNFTLSFGHADDQYYEHRLGTTDGYHALLRMDGSIELWAHRAGVTEGTVLARGQSSGSPPGVGVWIPLRLEVTPSAVVWTRTDTGASVTARDSRYRGDFLHIGRSASDGRLSVRNLRLS